MAQENKLSISIQESDLTEINAAIETIQKKLLPYLVNLKGADIKELPKMGDKTVAFVTKAFEYCSKNVDLNPPYLDVNEFQKDVALIETIRSLLQPIEQIYSALSDTMILAGSEAYQAALIFYNIAKVGAKNNIQKAKPIYSDLSSRFPGRNSNKKVES